MENGVKKKITIEVGTQQEQLLTAASIQSQLADNLDYIYSNIVMRLDGDNIIRLYIFEGCESVPTIVI